MYLYSLDPPKNPNLLDEPAQSGAEDISARRLRGLPTTPPLYTNNKLTLALGFVPNQPPSTLDILPLSVGTDPGLALQTRKGTGYYKVPSLKGVWYRGHYLHEGAATSLEELFNPRRTSTDYVPGRLASARRKSAAHSGPRVRAEVAGDRAGPIDRVPEDIVRAART